MHTKTLFLIFITSIFSIISIKAQDQLTLKKNGQCGTCTIKPGQLKKFQDALKDSKLHYYTDAGTTKLDLKKAAQECNASYFILCNESMVLTSPGQKKDRIENVPSSNKKKGVTIGQIHNDTKGVKRPLLRVEITGGNEIRVVVTDSYLKGEGAVKNDLLVSFSERDYIDCKIEINKSSNKISVYVKNKTTGKKKSKSYTVSKLWQEMDGQFYFKAGAYTQVSGPKTKVSYDKFNFIY